jgi:enoyl-CoA hydratase/carnithine racemase
LSAVVPRAIGDAKSPSGRLVDLARVGRVATITLNRPEKLNAISDELLVQLQLAVSQLATDGEVEVVVLTGAGRAFCAGFDISRSGTPELVGTDADAYWQSHFRSATEMLLGIWDLPQPVIAKVHGACLGGGMQMLLCCDLRVAAEDTIFGEPEIEFGGIPSFPVLAMSVSFCQASEMLLTGERLGAHRACEMGLLNRVVPAPDLDREVAALADKLARVPKGSLRQAKLVTHRAWELLGLRDLVRFGASVAADALSHRSGETAEFDKMVAEHGVRRVGLAAGRETQA